DGVRVGAADPADAEVRGGPRRGHGAFHPDHKRRRGAPVRVHREPGDPGELRGDRVGDVLGGAAHPRGVRAEPRAVRASRRL
ncbi:MAG: hypothetical protein AVDCRST_MAG54-1692, partial [uncultured Actinomycetospora sp.]